MWSTEVGGGAGHVAICYDSISSESFRSFDQNWNTPLECNIETHTYNHVLGWLRLKGSTPPTPQPTNKHKWLLSRAFKVNINYRYR